LLPFYARSACCLCFSLLAIGSSAAEPEPNLEEVIVTASLLPTDLNALPTSATVLNADALAAAGLTHFGDVLQAVPNLSFAGGTSRPRYFQIRGIGELEQYEGAPNPSVGFLIDDIDFSGIAMPAALFDMQQAEILRGPQGTALGANAIAGLVSLRSQQPVDHFAMRAEAEVANYDSYSAGLVINNSTESGNTAWRLGVHRAVSDGFRRNAFLGRDDTNGFDENLVRLRVRSQLSDQWKLDVVALYGDADNGYDAWAIDNTRVTQSDRPGIDSQLSRAAAINLVYQAKPELALRSITTVADATMGYSFDGDWGNPAFWGANGPYDFFEDIQRRRRNVSQEFRLTAHAGEATDWVVGAYGLRSSERYALQDTYNGDSYRALASHYRATNLALYAQLDHRLATALQFSSGFRLERRAARYRDSNALANNPVDVMTGGHLSLSWDISPLQSGYVALTRGYKAGGINTTAVSIPDSLRQFDPEYLWNIEVGLRSHTTDGRLTARTSVFYMRRANQQVSSSVQPDPRDPLTFVLLTDNAAKGENLGLESELHWQVMPGLRVESNLALLRARFLSYQLEGRNLNKRDAPHAPNYQLGLALNWQHASGFFARADAQLQDGFYFSASHDERAASRTLANLQLGYKVQAWSVTAYARNVLNEHYAVRGFFFGNEPPDFANKRYIQNGDPRQIGLRFAFSY
jgi:iron complex outermembrane recepter protein